jgi:hypothetical protein
MNPNLVRAFTVSATVVGAATMAHEQKKTGGIHPVARTKALLPRAIAWRTGVLGALAVLIIMSQTGPASSQPPQPQQQQQPQRPQPDALKGFIAPLPPDQPTGIDPRERRCVARPSCPTGYRTFCVNPIGASVSCCHQWRNCEAIIR